MAHSSLNGDGSQLQMTFPGLDHAGLYTSDERARRLGRILSAFKETFKTESAIYLTFNRLSEADRCFLVSHWNLRGEWEAFVRLCRHLQVRVA